MKICGIISEYNPFHNGHKKHIELTRQKTGAKMIVCVMSGNFVQRGEPAIFDKWIRAACALKSGADVVVELPLLSAIQSAEGFAKGGVAVLNALGADGISFGCETEDIDMLGSFAKTLGKETRKYKKALKVYLREGQSYPKARMMAAFPSAPEEMALPNAILAIEYLKAINTTKSKLTPIAVKRVGQGYHSTDLNTTLSSATAIRKAFADNQLSSAYKSMPDDATDYICQQIELGLTPVFADQFDRELLFKLRLGGTAYIKTLHDVSEGLENRIYQAAKVCVSRQALIDNIKTKRYTYTRISRILLYALLGITKDMIKKQNRTKIDHLRILGVKNSGVLSTLNKTCRVPIIAGSVKSSSYPSIDVAASDIYALSQSTPPFCSTCRDFTQRLIVE